MGDNSEYGSSENEEQYSSEHNTDNVSRKRRHEDEEEEEEGEEYPAKRPARARDILFRIVVPSNQIGKVIGKQGSKIKQLREETGAIIKIADAVTPLEERVIIISSKGEEKEEKSAAEHALIQIVTVILEESGESTKTTKVGSQHAGPNMMRLLIAGSQAGSLIGISGKTINEIRKDSGAKVQIMAQNNLPICASASETDRLVQISGEISQVLKALEYIGGTLREHPPKEVISMRPTYQLGSTAANPLILFHQPVHPGYTMQLGNSNSNSTYLGAAGRAASRILPMVGGISATSALPKVTMKTTISSSVVGGLIGRRGSNISQIRSLSGAVVKVTGEKDFAAQRTIYFEGTAEQVAAAQSLVNTFINAPPQ